MGDLDVVREALELAGHREETCVDGACQCDLGEAFAALDRIDADRTTLLRIVRDRNEKLRRRLLHHDGAQVAPRCTMLPDDCGSPARCVAAGACQAALTPGDVEANCRHCGRPQSSHRSLTVLECAGPYRTTFEAQKGAGRGR